MPTLALMAHPASAVPAHWRVEVQLELSADALRLHYRFYAADLRLPAAVTENAALRADDLWQHTCAELFVASGDDDAYREFNFSPSGQWAAYDFERYRQRAAALPAIAAPRIAVGARGGPGAELTEMTVLLPLAALPDTAYGPRSVGLTAVLEAADGLLSYWALMHPERTPNFHHRAGFTLPL